MKTKSSHKTRTIRLFSYIIALIAVLFVFAVSNHKKSEQYRLQMEIGYQRALNELSEYLDDIDTSLSKGIYSSTPSMMSRLTATLIRTSAGAKNALSQLPISDLQLDNTYKFLSQLGDYSIFLNKKVACNGKLSNEEYENLKSFIPILSGLSDEVNTAISRISSSGFFTQQTASYISDGNNETTVPFADSIQSAENNIENYPTLIYDGPFSDHIMQMSPKLLANKSEISREDASKLAMDYGFEGFEGFEYAGDENSTIEQYCFSAEDSSIGISKKGGYLCYFISSVSVTQEQISQEEAVKIAKNMLTKFGFFNMVQSYYSTTDGKCTVNFAFKDGDVTYYPDLIKVTVALDTGNVIGFDARGYIMNHCLRQSGEIKLSLQDASEKINPQLKILGSKLCVIPSSGKNEFLCYEFHCACDDGQEYLVYIDTATGEEADILVLLYSDGGTLTK